MSAGLEVFLGHVIYEYDELSEEDKDFYRDLWASRYWDVIRAYREDPAKQPAKGKE